MSLLRAHLSDQAVWTQDRGQETPDRFTETTKEFNQLNTQSALIDFSHGGVVRLSGEERQNFLSGLVTNQVKSVSASKSVHACMLSAQGRFLWDFTLIERDGALLIVTEPDRVDMLVQQLTFYKLRSAVDIQDDTQALGTLGLVGPDADAILAQAFPDANLNAGELGDCFEPEPGVQVWRDPRLDRFGWRVLASVDALPALWDRLCALTTPAGVSAWNHYRLTHGLPQGGVDLVPTQHIPAEGGLVDLNSVSFTKGCFVGQETTARTHHRGTVKKRLFSLVLESGPTPEPGVDVQTPTGKVAGTISSVSSLGDRTLALGILRVSDVEKSPDLRIGEQVLQAKKPVWAQW